MLTKINFPFKISFLLFLLISLFSVTSCELIGDIFKAGVWTGVIIIALIVALLIYIFSRFRHRD